MNFLSDVFSKIVPPEYSGKVALNKVAMTTGKVAVSILMASKAGPFVQAHTAPENLTAVQGGIGLITGAILETGLDYIKMHCPESLKWLR